MSRLVVVSNRVAVPEPGRVPTGGLAVGVLSALEEQHGLWFGCDGRVTEDGAGEPRIVESGGITFARIDLSERDHDGYYNGFSNNILWPLFHYLLGYYHYEREQYEAYRRVNRTFAEKLIPLLEPDDFVWVHDYHLIPLGMELRERGVDLPIGFFLHVPFPEYSMLRVLPSAGELIRAMCEYDVVGFQTPGDLSAFGRCVEAGLGGKVRGTDAIEVEGRTVRIGCFPIGVDVDLIARVTARGGDPDKTRRLAQSLHGRTLVIGADRLDYSKGLPERVRSFQRFLERYPERRGRSVFLQIAQPSRTEVRDYATIRRELEAVLGHTNARYAEFDWMPVRLLERFFPRETLLGFMRFADVGLVTPLRDGMNLVAKEYVASQDPEDPGVLVLSALAGAAVELDEALVVNPYDADGVADAIERAVVMPLGERRERHRAMLATLRRNDVHAWRNRFLDALAGR